MSSPKSPTDLSALDDQYEIVGEIRGRTDASCHLARRREPEEDVMVLVFRSPTDDRGNALAQLASDTHLLKSVRHENAVPVLEGRWIGRDRYAVVLERVDAPTLDELITRDDGLAYQRIAAILQEINSVLVWAREQGIVHRGVTLDTVYVEPATNRVWVSFAVRPIPMTGVPDETDDARTIARMAWAMIAGSMPSVDEEKAGIATAHPDLSRRVAADIDRVLACKPGEDCPDVPAFISVVAMADALKDAEDEVARLEAEFREVLRTERAKWDAEREEAAARAAAAEAEFKRQVAEFEKEAQRRRETLASDRSEMEERLTRERDQLVKDNGRLEAARADVETKRTELERRIRDLEARRAEVDRERAAEKKKLAAEWRELDRLRAALPAFAAADATDATGSDDAAESRDLDAEADHLDAAEPLVPLAPAPGEPRLEDPIMEPLPPLEAFPSLAPRAADMTQGGADVLDAGDDANPPTRGRARWAVSAAALAIVAIIIVSAFGLGRDDPADAIVDTSSPALATPPVAGIVAPVAIDSASGAVGQLPDSGAVETAATVDSATTPATPTRSVAPPASQPREAAPRRTAPAPALAQRTDSAVGPPVDSAATIIGPPAPPASLRPIGAPASRQVADSVRADSARRAARADSIRRDSLARPRPDTVRRPPPDTGSARGR